MLWILERILFYSSFHLLSSKQKPQTKLLLYFSRTYLPNGKLGFIIPSGICERHLLHLHLRNCPGIANPGSVNISSTRDFTSVFNHNSRSCIVSIVVRVPRDLYLSTITLIFSL